MTDRNADAAKLPPFKPGDIIDSLSRKGCTVLQCNIPEGETDYWVQYLYDGGSYQWESWTAAINCRLTADRNVDAVRQGAKPPTGSELIAAERTRQVEVEGWTESHDLSEHSEGDLALAGACYAIKVRGELATATIEAIIKDLWPFDWEWWKPKDRIQNLVRAGALIAAEIDRLQNR